MKYRPGMLLRAIVDEVPVYAETIRLDHVIEYVQFGACALVVSSRMEGFMTWIQLLTSSGVLGWRPSGHHDVNSDGLFKRIAG